MEIRVPEVGESVREALLAKWFKKNGESVKKDEALCEIETDKITLDINADAAGVLSVAVAEGATIPVGTVIGSIDEQQAVAAVAVVPSATVAAPAPAAPVQALAADPAVAPSSPAARREMREQGIDPASVVGTGKGGRITLDDLFSGIAEKSQQGVAVPIPSPDVPAVPAPPQGMAVASVPPAPAEGIGTVHSEEAPLYAAEREERRAMSPIRKRIAERLVAVRRDTAMLTTFNEADLSHIMALRDKYRDHFQKRHGVKLGFMPFFVKACVEALREFPSVNASIDGDDIVYHHYYDIGIAVGGEKGLVVPILRNAERLHFHEVEQAISGFSEKIKTNRLAISDLEGGTFTISNGGVYGSMLSTPILNPPQSGVLGMHAIQERPVVRDGQIVIRPMMFLALSYDHRIIDGREAVGFLKSVKEYIEDPEELLLEG
ncbi:2-oxoglutarate dehydrogenase complex dihydrolipoyllysine-residue succinyltransferase [Oryzomonas japonica]|uniref:Dihydrolipoyllysine-residue succinyltransferase component of 2-oxoglutarate dehydrogenase complex n=1 Tax=Oryzomonas japonica TaxID=2603858 RepID=A0A7J4ZSS7_9BACT|nr:2-oxoglutarate dehydrogenase complex dihydrolipoyllysine-residue succinyltransferase [Oryzomonas japonica]KAB0666461.1 2-oxoglutarate dehydrogenase complex dihydrolipoyllysine-residue succinyltransferase [Oryzomonas japonica]